MSSEQLEITDSGYTLSITTNKAVQLSISLPKVVRSFEDFLRVDIATGDSDPVYWSVAKAAETWGTNWAAKFCVGMLTYYHMGTAVKAADLDGQDFWGYMLRQFPNGPRGGARRHFRGAGGEQTLASMMAFAPNPVNFFQHFPTTYAGVRSVCENKLYGFGPYFQLKICDYMDRCLGIPIRSYDGLERNLPGEPAKAVASMYPNLPVSTAFHQLCKAAEAWRVLAAPGFDRYVGPAEIETSLCGWKSTKYKGNWFGADIQEKHDTLKGCGERGVWMANWLPPIIKREMFKLELQ